MDKAISDDVKNSPGGIKDSILTNDPGAGETSVTDSRALFCQTTLTLALVSAINNPIHRPVLRFPTGSNAEYKSDTTRIMDAALAILVRDTEIIAGMMSVPSLPNAPSDEMAPSPYQSPKNFVVMSEQSVDPPVSLADYSDESDDEGERPKSGMIERVKRFSRRLKPKGASESDGKHNQGKAKGGGSPLRLEASKLPARIVGLFLNKNNKVPIPEDLPSEPNEVLALPLGCNFWAEILAMPEPTEGERKFGYIFDR